MSKPWGGVGAWALDAERAEAEERELAEAAQAAPAGVSAVTPSDNFPSLRESIAAGGKKKKKRTTLSLSEFSIGSYVGPGGANRHPAAVSDEILVLPTGPRERSDGDNDRMGGGFRSYGGFDRSGTSRPHKDGFGGDFGGGGRRGFDEDSRHGPAPSRFSDQDLPSRADEVDNWAIAKKSFAPTVESVRRDRYGALGNDGAHGQSRADEIDDWSRGKKTFHSQRPAFGSAFRDSAGPSGSDSRVLGGDHERPRLVLNPPKRDGSGPPQPVAQVVLNRPSPFGAARPREEVLAEKGRLESEVERNINQQASLQSSRPSSVQSSRSDSVSLQGDEVPKPRPKVNPFGDAKPREVVLAEKGKDWRKIDLELEHRSVDRTETTEEVILKKQIDDLKEELERKEAKMQDGAEKSDGDEVKVLHDVLSLKEKELEVLIHELDDKVRFRPRSSGSRPGSGAGRITALSQVGTPDEAHILEPTERPHSRGGQWGKPVEERWGFQGVRNRGGPFQGQTLNRSRERW